MEARTKSFDACFKQAPDGQPTDGDLALVNKYSLVPLAAEQLYVRTIELCNTQYDRSFERFPAGYLNRFRDTLLGKSLLLNHDKRNGMVATGKFFRTNVATTEGGKVLEASFYLTKTPGNEELRAQIDAGVVSHASVGFRFADLVCDLCGVSYYGSTRNDATGERVWCPHVLGEMYDGKRCTATYGGDLSEVEAVEASLVYLGCQYGSEITKSALWDGDPAETKEAVRKRYFARNHDERLIKENGMSEEEKTTDVGPPTADDGAPAAGSPSMLELTQKYDVLQKDLAAIEPTIADGRLYREDLKAEIKRLAGICEATKEAELILGAAAAFDCTQLKALVREYEARVEKRCPPRGQGEPAQPREGADAPAHAARRPEAAHRVV